MNMNGVYASEYSAGLLAAEEQNHQPSAVYEKGQILEGIITRVSDEVSIDFDGKEMNFSKDVIQNPREGEVRKFQVMEVSKNSLVLKEIGNTVSSESGGAMICTRVENGKTLAKEEKALTETDYEAVPESVHAEQMTGEDYEMLEEEGIAPEKLLLERLDQMVVRVKEQRSRKEESLLAQKEQLEEKTEQVRKQSEFSSADGLERRIARRLAAADLPVTKENIEQIADAVRQAEQIVPPEDASVGYLLKNNLSFTIENIYKAVYSGSKAAADFPEDVFETLKEPILLSLSEEGMNAGEEELRIAKRLLAEEIPVTAAQVDGYRQLMQMRELSEEDIIGLTVRTLKEGKTPEQTNLAELSDREIQKEIKEFSGFSDEALRYAAAKKQAFQSQPDPKEKDSSDDRKYHADQELTLQDLRKAAAELGNGAAAEVIKELGLNPAEVDIAAVHARRQLEEIRLKLTVESGHKLAEKGIQLDTMGLSRIVEGLREIEQDYYRNLMKEAGGTATGQEVSLLQQTTEAVESLKQAPSALLGLTYSRRNEITVGALAEAGKESRAVFQRAEEAYETLGTSPRADLGDSIQKAFRNVDSILQDLGMELTEANRRAVRILGHNNMELNRETIDEIKLYDAKVNQMFENLQPSVTVELIRKGENPLELTVDEVNSATQEIREELGITEEERFSSYLADLERKDGITPEERESFIGIYRLLHQISKSDGAAVGSVVKAGQELTLKNLLTAARIRNGNGVDEHLDDTSGRLEANEMYLNGIDRQIRRGLAAKPAVDAETKTAREYGTCLTDRAREVLTPEHLAAVSAGADDGLEGMTLEAFTEALGQAGKLPENTETEIHRYEQRAEELRNTIKNSRDVVRFLKHYHVPDSAETISAAKGLAENGGLAETLKHLEEPDAPDAPDALLASLEDADKLQKEYQKFAAKLDDTINTMLNTSEGTAEQRQGLLGLRGQIRLAGKLARQECYEIPVKTTRGITNMNLKVIRNGGSSRVSVTTDGGHGLVRVEADIREDKLNCMVTSETAAGLEQVRSLQKELISQLSDEGIEVKQINYSVDKNNVGNYFRTAGAANNSAAEGEKTDTAVLYRAAKVLVSCLCSQD